MGKLPNYLIESIKNGKAVLFTGAGFSLNASNKYGPLPSSRGLKAQLFQECKLTDNAEDFSLTQAYSIAERILGSKKTKAFIKRICSECMPTQWQKTIVSYLWFRIYTTNIDDALEKAFSDVSMGRIMHLVNGTGPAAECHEGPGNVDYIKLHGTCDGQSELIFGVQEYARMMQGSFWMQFFAGDFESRHIIFVGSSLQDPDFWHHIQSRKNLSGIGIRERPVCFAVAPDSDGPLSHILRDLNIEPLPMTGEDFARTLVEEVGVAMSLDGYIRKTVPFAYEKKDFLDFPSQDKLLFERMYIPIKNLLKVTTKGYRSAFFLGCEPTWIDIVQKRDAERDLTGKLLECFSSQEFCQGSVITGPAGTGKTTLLMRIAEKLSLKFDQCYWFEGDQYPNTEFIKKLISASEGKVFLFIDNIGDQYEVFRNLLKSLPKPERQKLFIYGACRTRDIRDNRESMVTEGFKLFRLNRLTNNEIPKVLEALRKDGMLGLLKNKTSQQQFREFEVRARKTLLVALREATKGPGFENILRDEYIKLEPKELKQIYLAVALPHMNRLPLSRHLLTAFLYHSGLETYRIDSTDFIDVIPSFGTKYITTRHPIIAEIICKESSNPLDLKDTLITLLKVLAPAFEAYNYRQQIKGYTFRLMKKLINYEILLNLFKKKYSIVEEIYFGIKAEYEFDPHYWLHYGSLCIDSKDFERAHTYLLQSREIFPLYYTTQQIGRLFLLKAIHANSKKEAKQSFLAGYDELFNLRDLLETKTHTYTTLLNLLTAISTKWGKNEVFPEEYLTEIANSVINDSFLKSNRRTNNALKKALFHLKVG